MIRIIIADDHAVVRTGLQLIFDTTQDLEIISECKNGNEFLQQIREKEHDVAILDVSMPGRDAIDVLKTARIIRPNLPVVIFTMNSEDAWAIRFFKSGASAFINKETHPDMLISAIRTVYRGKKYFTMPQMERMSSLLSGGEKIADDNHEALTDREFQVLCLIAAGESAAVISKKLSVSKNTVSNHRNNILKKMNLKNNADLTRYAIKNSIIT